MLTRHAIRGWAVALAAAALLPNAGTPLSASPFQTRTGPATTGSAPASPRGVVPGTAATSGITEADRLSSIYDVILSARFAEASAQLARACPPAPAAACAALREVALWWEIQEDPGSRRLDAPLEAAAASAIDAATRWTEQEPDRAEAWFYLAAAHAPLAQWRVLRGERLAAARDGKRMKTALERALALDDQFDDAWFGIGLYHYYADVAPAAVKLLRFLLLLPGGDRAQGLREMVRARDRGALLRREADYQLHWIYLWYEEQPERALDLLRSLDARYPSNPLFLIRIAEVQRDYFHDHIAAGVTSGTLLDRARAGRTALPALTTAQARLGLAAAEIELGRPDAAIELVTPLLDGRATPPYNVRARATLAIADAHARAGRATAARNAYRRAIADAVADDPDDVRGRARRALTRVGAPR